MAGQGPGPQGTAGHRLLTFGHAALGRDRLTPLLLDAGVTDVVDVRRFPWSRTNEDVRRDALDVWLPRAGIGYRWEPRLGGRRHLTKVEDAASPDTWWQVAAFRAYAGWTRGEEFGAGMADLLAQDGTVVIMCSEALWWRCHRRVVSDVAVLLHGVDVRHLMHDGSLRPHPPAAGARVVGGQVVWDGA